MKFTRQETIGILATIALATAIVLITTSDSRLTYNTFRIDGNGLKNLYGGDFSKLSFQFIIGGSKVDMQPVIYNRTRSRTSTPPGLWTSLGSGTVIPGSRILDGSLYNLEPSTLSNTRQLDILISLATANPGGYFEFIADKYEIIDPTKPTYIYYKIVGHKANNGGLMDIRNIDPRALQLDPSPPAPAY